MTYAPTAPTTTNDQEDPGDDPEFVSIDLDRLAERGPSAPTPCVICESPTRSHVLIDTGDVVDELTGGQTLNDIGPSHVRFIVVCHSCYTDLSLPAGGDWYDDLVRRADDREDSNSVFSGVVA